MAVKPLKILLYLTIILLFTVAVVITLLLNYDWNAARPYVNSKVSAMTGRVFAVDGDLKIQLVSGSRSEPGWQGYLTSMPLLRISADDVHISNPTWSHVGPEMAIARRVVILLKPLELLRSKVDVIELDLDAPLLALEKRSDRSSS